MSAVSREIIAAPHAPRTTRAYFGRYRPEFGHIMPRQSVTWTLGYGAPPDMTFRVAGERLCEALALRPDERVLTVTAGNRCNALDRQESLPFRGAAFDAVISAFGSMYLPDPVRTADELLRVCRPGGRIGLACWTPDGFNGRINATIERYRVGDSPVPHAETWGSRERLDWLFGHAADALGAASRVHTWRYESPAAWLAEWRSQGGPLQKAFDATDPEWRDQLASDLLALADSCNQSDDGSMLVHSEYVEFLVHKSNGRD